MEIVFHNHDAPISERMRRRAEQLVLKVACRLTTQLDHTKRTPKARARRLVRGGTARRS